MTPPATIPTSKLQRIDRWAGVPVCFLLTCWRVLTGGDQPARAFSGGKILFIKFAEQGSTVLAQGAIRRAAKMVGRENVYFAVFTENRFILDVLNLVPAENVFTINAGNIAALAKSALTELRKIRRTHFEAVVDLEFFSRSSAAFSFLAGARRRVGFHTFFGEGPYRGDLMTHRLLYNPHLHTSEIFAMMVKVLEVDPENLPTFGATPHDVEDRVSVLFEPQLNEIEGVRAILERESKGCVIGSPLFLLNANASDLLPLRRWAPERYIELAGRLLTEYPAASVVMTGAPSEADAARKMADSIGSKRCFSLAGKTSLRQLLVLYTLADVLITNDSGPAHFASLTAVDVITLFGPETPRLFAALTPRNTPLWSGVACSPCVNAYNNRQTPCRNNVCMQQIGVEQVFDATKTALARRRAGQN